MRHLRGWSAAALVCVASWAVGPTIGIALALHELEHHVGERHDHTHAAAAAQAILHGHLHGEDAREHEHGVAPSRVAPTRAAGPEVPSQQATRAISPLQTGDGPIEWRARPEPASLDPPTPYRLCVLRL